MLNTQITSYLGAGRQETSSERAEETNEEPLLGKSGKRFLTVIDIRKVVFGWKSRRIVYCIVLQTVLPLEYGDLWTKRSEGKARFPLILTAKKRGDTFSRNLTIAGRYLYTLPFPW